MLPPHYLIYYFSFWQKLQQIEQTISVTVLGQDSVPPAVDSTAFQALWCSPGKEGGAMWAAERIFSAPAGEHWVWDEQSKGNEDIYNCIYDNLLKRNPQND